MSRTNILLLTVISLFYLSCSSSRPASTGGSQKSSIFPGWYSGSNELAATQNGFAAYGMAVSADSSSAVEKAVTQALANLEQHISDRLESIRNEVVRTTGDDSGLDSSAFIFALRNAEGEVSGLASNSRKQAQPNSKFNGYHGFAEVTLSRRALIDYLDSALSSNSTSWEAFKTSKAFQQL